MPTMERDKRPAPPPGAAVVTVPEAVALAEERARQRGDRRALLMQQDIRKDIAAGRFVVGQDAFWVHIQAHPKGGYWVVTVDAVENRIQERLRGRGRPRKPEPLTPGEPVPLLLDDTTGETDAVEMPAEPETLPGSADNPAGPPLVEEGWGAVHADPVSPGGAEEAGFTAVVSGDRGYQSFPVADPEQYRRALTEATKLEGHQWGLFYVCRCGWAGQEAAMHVHPDGRPKYAGCPSCSRPRTREDMGYVSAVAREIPWVQRQITAAAERTRTKKWATEMHKHLGHLQLLARQAILDEPVTPGVAVPVADFTDHVRRLMSEAVILPTAMRTEPSYLDLDALAKPNVQPAMERLDFFRFDGPVAEELLDAVKAEGADVFARAILDGVVPWEAVWSTLRWLAGQEAGGRDLEYPARLMELLGEVPVRDLEEARMVYHQVRRWGKDFYVAGDEWAKADYGVNRQRWRAHRPTVEIFHNLLSAVDGLLMTAARARVKAQVDAEVERLVELARSESERTNREPVQVAVGWVSNKSKKVFASPEIMRLVAYPLAQRLLSDKVPEAPL